VDEDLMQSLILVNVERVTRVTHSMLPTMVDKKRGAIINIGSFAE
jgi:17beta-estradiol 17-dehydrogenase / very-long-chain 3-oxoacyl-CoA reductase